MSDQTQNQKEPTFPEQARTQAIDISNQIKKSVSSVTEMQDQFLDLARKYNRFLLDLLLHVVLRDRRRRIMYNILSRVVSWLSHHLPYYEWFLKIMVWVVQHDPEIYEEER